jgi:CubicO group peptidase (beta-lactamase class C family)
LLLGAVPVLAQTPSPDSPRYLAAVATSEFLQGQASASEFVRAKLAASVLEELGAEAAATRLSAIRTEFEGYEVTGLQPAGPQTARLRCEGSAGSLAVLVDFDPEPPHGITNIAIEGGSSLRGGEVAAAEPERREQETLTWETLDARIESAVEDGFSGVILAIRDGEPVLDGAFGMANREQGIPNRKNTIFGIGSTPIDFTHVGILMLAEQGKLTLDDPITKYFDNVPEDKRSITLRHLMTGGSGLQNFHGQPADGNPDHAWIDLDEAMRRIVAQELLFEPGQGNEHSHSAWGVLAAVLEIVSGESYQEFTEKRIFKPLGMVDTGFYGEKIPQERMAVGYGMMSNGEVNAPPYWGPTSWLVLGSGGQVSTVGDMHRFVTGMRGGKLLNEEMRERFLSSWRGVLAGGSIFGYEIIYTTDADNMMILISNYNPDGGDSTAVALAEDIANLTMGRTRPRFSLGIGLEMDSETGLTVSQVVAGSAAERDGLKTGDRLISANGTPFGDDALAVLDPFLASGEKITFAIEREGKKLSVGVQPNPR